MLYSFQVEKTFLEKTNYISMNVFNPVSKTLEVFMQKQVKRSFKISVISIFMWIQEEPYFATGITFTESSKKL